MPWKVLEVEFQKRTSLRYDKNKLKNKWDWLKNRWSLWKALKGKETGLVAQGILKFTPVMDCSQHASVGYNQYECVDEMTGSRKSAKVDFTRKIGGAALLTEKLDIMLEAITQRNKRDMELMKLEVHGDSSRSLADSLAKLLSMSNLISGKYYLADKGYPERNGFLTPYHKTRYHPSEFRGANPRGPREVFNRAHSSLRSCIERAFGILKARWKILEKMPKYSMYDQNRTICVAFALHNYIRLSKVHDPAFNVIDKDPNFIPPEAISNVAPMQEECQQFGTNEMTKVHNDIATSLMIARRRRHDS
ncbi:hypothetical protein V6N11_050121 [Hibiscus sabdariffa]|uniref:DDE Tnp4 domain-containing protein n=1 Tax=Hibiscus sabdariffa TaxID=183260 RepID=A0ABR2T8W9_9ROSI